MSLALDEAITNAIVHGNLEVDSTLKETSLTDYGDLIEQRSQENPYQNRNIEIVCRFSEIEAIFEITDQGPGFNVSSIPNPTEDEYLERPCGRGMLIMRTFMDQVEYNEIGNRVTLTKNFMPQAAENLIRESRFFEAQEFILHQE